MGKGGGGGYISGSSRGERVGATSDKQAQLEVPHLKMQVGLDSTGMEETLHILY